MRSQIEAAPGTAEFWVETCFDMLFLVDIGINFNTAVVTETGVLAVAVVDCAVCTL